MRKKVYSIFPTLILTILLGSCGLHTRPPSQDSIDATIERDTSCSYFYFLWGTHEEYSHHYQEALEAYQKSLICDPATNYVSEKIPILYLKMDEPGKAVDLLTRELKSNPDDVTKRSLLARIYLQQKDLEKAIAQYLQINKQEPENEQALLRLGVLITQSGDLENGKSYFSDLLKINPESYFSHLYLARIADQLNQVREAEEKYQSALYLNWSEDLLYEISDFYLRRNDFDKNLHLLRTSEKRLGNDERLKLTIVQTLLALEQEEEAIAELSLALGNNSSPADFSLIISRLHLRNGNKTKAIENLKALLGTENVPEARYLLAVIYVDDKNYSTALDVLKEITSAHNEFEDGVILKSQILHQTARNDEAIAMLKGYLAAKNTRRPLFYSVASSLLKDINHFEEATEILKQGISHFPGNERLLFQYGLQLERANRLEEAIDVMQQIIANNPDHAEALNFVGYSWADTDRNIEKALQYIVKAMEIKPGNGYIQDSLGWVHFKLGNLERARTELSAALELVPDDPYIHEHLGDVYHALKMIKQALVAYHSALKLYEDEKKKKTVRDKIEQLKKL